MSPDPHIAALEAPALQYEGRGHLAAVEVMRALGAGNKGFPLKWQSGRPAAVRFLGGMEFLQWDRSVNGTSGRRPLGVVTVGPLCKRDIWRQAPGSFYSGTTL